MVLLQSKNFELSTNDVIEWLVSLKTPFLRINEDDVIQVSSFRLSANGAKITLKINDIEIDFDELTAYWHRRGKITFNISKDLESRLSKDFPKKQVKGILKNFTSQYASLEYYLNKKFTQFPRKIGDSSHSVINKLTALENAISCGIQVPETIITTSKSDILKFKKNKNDLITKSILDSIFLWDDYDMLVHYTESLDDKAIERLPDMFALSLIQQQIPKKFELRIFYLKDKFYSMAIFSQADMQTAVDFRKYNDVKPNRAIPFLLPVDVESKLMLLMKKLKLDTGSIDMIVSEQNEYIFLEVNPVGQFGMVSYPCNYYIEREIANYLSGLNILKHEQI